jgi:hypothetical protein
MSVHLELGDIIKIISPTDQIIHEQILLISYINDTLIRVNNEKVELNLSIDAGVLSNKSIESIELLSRSEQKGYVKQANLLPGKWINIQINNDIPIIITAKIVHSEEDMIEVITWPGKETLYFDFEYKGPIENIIVNIRDVPDDYAEITKPPSFIKDTEAAPETEVAPVTEVAPQTELDESDIIESDFQQLDRDVVVKEKIKEIIFDADSIVFGEELDSITQQIEVSDDEMRYGIDAQTSDMVDDFLADIPTSKRSKKIINKIHTIIERYIQLRKEFSTFDEQNNPTVIKTKGPNNKPLTKYLKTFDHDIKWLVPVVKNIKKVYDITDDAEDVTFLELFSVLERENLITAESFGQDDTNTYTSLYNNLNDFYTPFEDPTHMSAISNIEVSGIINAVVNNIGILHSSAVSDEMIIQKNMKSVNYVNGLQKISIIEKQGSNIITEVKQMTPSNKLAINGILLKPLNAIDYSTIYLHRTNMLHRVSLHNEIKNYFSHKTIDTDDYTATIDTVNQPLEYINFGLNQKLIMLDDNLYGQEDIYERFIDHVIPKIKELFTLFKDNISNPYSFHEIIKKLEPFLIYQNDITYQQYNEIYEYVVTKIIAFRKTFSQNKIDFNKYTGLKNYIFERFKQPFFIENYPNIVKYYNILDTDLPSTILSKASVDGMNGLSALISDYSKNLYSNINIDERISTELEERDRDKATSQTQESLCDKYIISNKYDTIQQLEADNGREILFHKDYDNTRYEIISEYPRNEMNTINYMRFIADKLKTTVGLSEENAARDAEAMVSGKRITRNNDIAILNNAEKPNYYRRVNNVWVVDPELTSRITAVNNKDMCNMQDSCIYIKKQCVEGNSVQREEDDDQLKIIIGNINREIEIDSQEIVDEIEKKLARAEFMLFMIYQGNLKTTINKTKAHIASTLVEESLPSSPYTKLLYAILALDDFSLKQTNIYTFYQQYTVSDESVPFMYICKDTHIPILPTFLVKLAEAYKDGKYTDVMEQICKEQGELSDDGDKWVDKHSGYTIKQTDLFTEEGYDNSGYKNVSRSIIEEESTLNIASEKTEYENPDAQTIFNIVSSLTTFIGIDISASHEFIINQTLIGMKDYIPSTESYQKKIERAETQGKKIPSYDYLRNNILLIFTLVITFIIIQTQIPSIKTRKTFPNCTKSFSGYPLTTSDVDLTGITYIACIANKIKSKSRPWHTIYKLSDQMLIKKMLTICKTIIKKPDIKHLIQKKQFYLKTLPEDISIDEAVLENWITFLPPLFAVNNAPVKRITQPFYDKFETENLRNSDDLYFIFYKNYYLSLAIQKTIQIILNKEELLLKTNNQSNFLENACCNSTNYNTLNYFISKEKSIKDHIEQSYQYSQIYNDYISYNKPYFLVNDEDTKLIYPLLTDAFSEETIYYTFIHYCKFNTGILLSDEILSICKKNEIGFNTHDPIEDKISVMKSEGLNYTLSDLHSLLFIINRRNQIEIDVNVEIPSIKERFEHLLDYFNNSPHIDDLLIKKLLEIYTVYGTYKENKDIVDDVYNFTVTQNEEIEAELLLFLELSGKGRREINTVKTLLDSILEFELIDTSKFIIEEDNTALNYISFIKNTCVHFFNDNITIIKNKRDYNKCHVPSHWKLSPRHISDLQTFVERTYSKLNKFYENDELNNYLGDFVNKIEPLLILIENTPFDFSSSIEEDGLSIFNFDLIQQLFRYYLMNMFKKLIPHTEPEQLEPTRPQEEADALVTEQILEEELTGTISQLEIVQSNTTSLKTSIADLIIAFCEILQPTFNALTMNKKTIMEKVLYSKEKEKEHITTYLKDMSNEKREVENIFKNNKLGKWSKGITKGVVEYVGDVYDSEVAEMERHSIMEKTAENHGISAENRNIFMIDLENQMMSDQQINDEVNDLSGLADDDDHGDGDGDEHY